MYTFHSQFDVYLSFPEENQSTEDHPTSMDNIPGKDTTESNTARRQQRDSDESMSELMSSVEVDAADCLPDDDTTSEYIQVQDMFGWLRRVYPGSATGKRVGEFQPRSDNADTSVQSRQLASYEDI